MCLLAEWSTFYSKNLNSWEKIENFEFSNILQYLWYACAWCVHQQIFFSYYLTIWPVLKIIFQKYSQNYIHVKWCMTSLHINNFGKNWPILPICGSPGEKIWWLNFWIGFDDSRLSPESIANFHEKLCSFFLIPRYAHVTFIHDL